MRHEDGYTCDKCGLQAKEIEGRGWLTEVPFEDGLESTHQCKHCFAGHRDLSPEEVAIAKEATMSAVQEMAGHSYFNADGRYSLAYHWLKQTLAEGSR